VQALFCVYDGHGASGDKASEFTMRKVADLVEQKLTAGIKEPEALRTAFLETDALLKADRTIDAELSGTTAVAMLLRQTGSKREAWLAWVGDSRAVLCLAHAGGAVSGTHAVEQLTRDHKPDDPDETTRIEAAGGSIWDMEDGCGGRVVGPDHVSMLQVARSLGSLPPCLPLPACMCSPRRLRLPTGGT
jgi:serine/threonine protein phosphatase PrpC